MSITIVSLSDRPDLATTTGTWRWRAFFQNEAVTLEETIAGDIDCAASAQLIPTVLVLLENDQPAGMVTLCHDDLKEKPEHNPWLAGLYVAPDYRGKGYSRRLLREMERLAANAGIRRLSLFTANAVDLYRKAGWQIVDKVVKGGQAFAIMQKFVIG